MTSKKTYILNFGIGCVHVLIFDVKINIYLSERQRQKDREIERQTERHAEKEKDRQRQTKTDKENLLDRLHHGLKP